MFGGGDSGIQAAAAARSRRPSRRRRCASIATARPTKTYVDKATPMPEQLEHGEVLVAARSVRQRRDCCVQTPLTILNDFPPFNRTRNKWEEIGLPAIAGVEGVGVVMAGQSLGRLDKSMDVYKDLLASTPPGGGDL